MSVWLPKVSIITVVYNGEKFLQRTIDSVKNQTYANVEYIIIDGKSHDQTLSIIKKNETYITKYISEPDDSLYEAMNKGINLSTGKYIWFINNGDLIHNKDSLKNALLEFEDADIYYSDTVIIKENGQEIGLLSDLTRNNAPKDMSWKSQKYGMVVCHQSFIVKKTSAPLFNLKYKYSNDIEWMIACMKKSEKLIKTQTILSKFMTGGVSRKYFWVSMKERYYILKNYFGFFQNLQNHIFIIIRFVIDRFITQKKKGI